MKLPEIAVVRGRQLNNFEMQSYMPFLNKCKLVGFASYFGIDHNFGPNLTNKRFPLLDNHFYPIILLPPL